MESSKIITTEDSSTYLQGIKLIWECKLNSQSLDRKARSSYTPGLIQCTNLAKVLWNNKRNIFWVWNSTYEHVSKRGKVADYRGCYKYSYDHTMQIFTVIKRPSKETSMDFTESQYIPSWKGLSRISKVQLLALYKTAWSHNMYLRVLSFEFWILVGLVLW